MPERPERNHEMIDADEQQQRQRLREVSAGQQADADERQQIERRVKQQAVFLIEQQPEEAGERIVAFHDPTHVAAVGDAGEKHAA